MKYFLKCNVARGFVVLIIGLASGIAFQVGCAAESVANGSETGPTGDYTTQIKPLLTARCVGCHGIRQQKGGLRLDSAALAIKGGLSGAAIRPGDPDGSLLLQRVSATDASERMPPEGEPLTQEQTAALREWIQQNAAAATDERPERDHWAFKVPTRPAIPQGERAEWNANPIDAFVAAEHAAHGVTPRPEAPRAALLRRVTLDLTGLPPTPDELHAFLNDASPMAYETVVDRLLSRPQHGERWGRHWMDVWRYSDWAGWTDGKQVRDSQPHIWRWRDWIVESLNADKPYDRMVTEMLASDELFPNDAEALRATGFLARNYKMLSRETWMQDTVQHTIQGFLGLTIGCARCHDHMYDAISQEEYYQLRANFEPHQVRLDRLPGEADTTRDGLARVFDSDLAVATYLFRKGDDRDPDRDRPLSPGTLRLLGNIPFEAQPIALPPVAYYPSLQPHVQKQLLEAAEAGSRQADAESQMAAQELAAALKTTAGPLDAVSADAARIKSNLAQKIAHAMKLQWESVQARVAADTAKYANPTPENAQDLALAAGKVEREAAFAQSQVELAKAELKRAAALIALKPGDAAFQQAVADAEKSLTEASQKRDAADMARQTVSAAYSPLGPEYPRESSGRRAALARWITHQDNPLTARVAVNQIWLRHFGQPLVPTVLDFGQNGQPPTHPALLDWLATELMEPSFGAEPAAVPWSLKRLHRLIVTSQTYRLGSTPDEGNLARDPDNRWLWRMPSRRMEAELVRDGILFVSGELDLTLGGPDIDFALGMQTPRRSLYFRNAQEKQMEFLKLFDCAAVTECYQRKESIVPQQALALANSELTLVRARLVARRLHSVVASDEQFIVAAFEQVLSRPPSPEEISLTVAFLHEQREKLKLAGERLAQTGGSIDDVVRPSAEPALRSRENLVHVLLNHNDFVTIR